jgi:hypothetical protein
VDELPAAPRKSIPEADRELLELAARALGAVRVEDVDGEEWLILHFADATEVHGWNSLLFYGDTFELAVKIGADLVTSTGRADVYCKGTRVSEYHGDNPVAAAARAVTRAAAEVGKQHSG